MAATLIKEILKRNFDQNKIPKEEIEDVILGNANGAGEENRNVARMSALLGGLPVTAGGVTVNRLCGSGMQAFIDGVRGIRNGRRHYLAGGVESMTRAPFVMPKFRTFGRKAEMFDNNRLRFTTKTCNFLFSMEAAEEKI
jgi:acetyl-CoA acetyltransferase